VFPFDIVNRNVLDRSKVPIAFMKKVVTGLALFHVANCWGKNKFYTHQVFLSIHENGSVAMVGEITGRMEGNPFTDR
jgi:hypothetical protein